MKTTKEKVIKGLDADIEGIMRALRENPYSESYSRTLLNLAGARLKAVREREADMKMEAES